MPPVKKSVLFNDNSSFVCRWLDRAFPGTTVRCKPVQLLEKHDLIGYRQVHLFAGIGGWKLALDNSNWPMSRPVWTGSCPCQPFAAGWTRREFDDPRHLWPEFFRLIQDCDPPTIFGEQVASAAGRRWLDRVRTDLEGVGYAVGAADLCAASVGAPHDRPRLWWVASRGVENPKSVGRGASADNGDSDKERQADQEGRAPGKLPTRPHGPGRAGDWGSYGTVRCRDGFSRRVEPGTLTVVNGFPSRVERIRAYGNAIVPPLASTFINSFLETESE